jgi:hypothetical protein
MVQVASMEDVKQYDDNYRTLVTRIAIGGERKLPGAGEVRRNPASRKSVTYYKKEPAKKVYRKAVTKGKGNTTKKRA